VEFRDEPSLDSQTLMQQVEASLVKTKYDMCSDDFKKELG